MNKPIHLYDSTNYLLKTFNTYKEANKFRMINNRYDWQIKKSNTIHC